MRRVFISYFHKEDQSYKDELVRACDKSAFSDYSVRDGDIDDTNLEDERIRQIIRDEYLRDASVTIVLLGKNTWRRKHVDWEISSTLRDTKLNSRGGLLGIMLPTHPEYYKNSLSKNTVPERFYDNWANDYAVVIKWANLRCLDLKEHIDKAFNKKSYKTPNNSAPLRRKNSEPESFFY